MSSKKPILVVLAAGMGSRYGGLKQLDPVGPAGQIIMDYSIYDARRAGFETVVFIIRREHDEAFRAAIGRRVAQTMQVRYAYQQLSDLPAPYTVPAGRTKPFGTAHAVLAARDVIDAPFAVINADDYYGPQAFGEVYNYLCTHQDGDAYAYCMVGYQLRNTVTQNGSVSRGVCTADSAGFLQAVTERTRIEQRPQGICYTEDGGQSWQPLPGDTVVSMNLWGFTPSFVQEAWQRFGGFLAENLAQNPLKCEYFLPSVVTALIAEGKARVQLLHSADQWHGVTYKEDRPAVAAAIARMTAEGLYPKVF